MVARKSTETACNAGDLGSVPGLEISSGEGDGYPLQYSALESSRVAKSQMRLSDFHLKQFSHGFGHQEPKFGWVVLAQRPSGGCSRDVGRGAII